MQLGIVIPDQIYGTGIFHTKKKKKDIKTQFLAIFISFYKKCINYKKI